MSRQAHKVLIVGTGFGCRIQIPAFRGAGFDVVGLVGTDQARTEQRAAQADVRNAFIDLGKAIEQTGADMVAVSSPPDSHAQLTIAALSRGCHVLCEKPFARDVDEARQMLAAATKAGKLHVLGNEFRFTEPRATMARALADGVIGEPRFASFVQFANYVSQYEEDIPEWWFDASRGGGWLACSGSHAVDQIRAWLGEFHSLSASLSTVTATRGAVDDSFNVRFTLENGLEGVLQQAAGSFGPSVEIARIEGTDGSIWLEDSIVRFANRTGTHEFTLPRELALAPPPPLTNDIRFEREEWRILASVEIAPYTELCRSIKAALDGTAPASPVTFATFDDGVANMAVLDAIRTSAEGGGKLQLVHRDI